MPELRKSGDIDLLVADQKAGEKAYEVLHEHGFRKAPEQHAHHHIVCVGTEQIGIEIHVALAEPFDSKASTSGSPYIRRNFWRTVRGRR